MNNKDGNFIDEVGSFIVHFANLMNKVATAGHEFGKFLFKTDRFAFWNAKSGVYDANLDDWHGISSF